MKKHYRHENDCLNCGTILQGHFCHVCGQENLEIKEGFGHLMTHTVLDYLHFDHQFFGTIKPLLFKPGFLTVEYMAGRRVRYLHPVKTYIFISVVYFLLLFQSGHEEVKLSTNVAHPGNITDTIDAKIAKNPNISSAAKQKIINHPPTENTSNIVFKKESYDELEKGPIAEFQSEDSTYEEYLSKQNKLPPAKRDNFFWHAISKKILTYKEKYGNMAQEVFIEELKHNVPKMMFLLLPLAAVIVGLAFRKNKKYYVEHLIYTFYLHCFLFLFLAMVLILQKIIPDSWGIIFWLNCLATAYIIWYIYKSLRVVYHRNLFRTITKMIGISLTYMVAFLLCFTLVLTFTAIF